LRGKPVGMSARWLQPCAQKLLHLQGPYDTNDNEDSDEI
jgi:hypothetical protein